MSGAGLATGHGLDVRLAAFGLLTGLEKLRQTNGSNDQNLWMALGLVTRTGAPSRG